MLTAETISLRNRNFSIIALGDFNACVGQIRGLENNIPELNSNSPLFKTFISSLNLTILNTLPISQGLFTHFVERDGAPFSQSILDYRLADSSLTPYITSFIIDSDARIKCGSDHALVLTTIKYSQGDKLSFHTSTSDVLKFKLPSDQDFGEFRYHLRVI